MTPTPPDPYVPWGIFEWAVFGFAATNAAFLTLFHRMFKRHLKDDDTRFEHQELRIQNMHLDNQKERSEMEIRLGGGQKRIEDKVDKLLFWHLGEHGGRE